jgi:hypothetical protein
VGLSIELNTMIRIQSKYSKYYPYAYLFKINVTFKIAIKSKFNSDHLMIILKVILILEEHKKDI